MELQLFIRENKTNIKKPSEGKHVNHYTTDKVIKYKEITFRL
jgi:hypothetical protein